MRGATPSFGSGAAPARAAAGILGGETSDRGDTGTPAAVAAIDSAYACKLLNRALAAELAGVMRYRRHHFLAGASDAEPVAHQFMLHSNEELGHADLLARRILQLGGVAQFNPAHRDGRPRRSTQGGPTLRDLVAENLAAERAEIELYRGLIRTFGDGDAETRTMLEGILAMEEGHADELAELLE
ncbi:MAG: bacterioferritin [Rhodocyclaceae bacterium]|nr:bacterioferritin [Rhodocyclaceae bacterium]